MSSFVSDLFLFIYTTLSYWQGLATGGIVAGAVLVIERLSGRSLSKRAFLGLFVGGFLLTAFFMGWRQEYQERLRQQAELNKVFQSKPQLRGEIQMFRVIEVPDSLPFSIGVVLILGISNVGTLPTIAEGWDCYIEVQDRNGNPRRFKGQARAVPDDLLLPRKGAEPLRFGRNDALYVKTINSPIGAGAKVVGVLNYIFSRDILELIRSNENNVVWVEFRDVVGQNYQAKRKYLQGAHTTPTSEWLDIPGMDRPLNQEPPKKP